MFKHALFVLSWFVAGGLAFYAMMLNGQIVDLSEELTTRQGFQQQYQEQLALNTRQREDYEARIQQLQSNLTGAQTQMANLSEALQEAREMLEPATQQLLEQVGGDGDL